MATGWSQVAVTLFRPGEHFYNFQGLGAYEEKFDPEWEPRYLAFPGGAALPFVLTHVAALISGGFAGALKQCDGSAAAALALPKGSGRSRESSATAVKQSRISRTTCRMAAV
jgi:hypothetical protein